MLRVHAMLAYATAFHCGPTVRSTRVSNVVMNDAGLLTGERLPVDVCERLGIESGQRVLLSFFCRDDGFECGKHLQDMQDRAASLQQKGCSTIYAVRSTARGAVKAGTAARYPALTLVEDDGDEIRMSMRMAVGGLRNGDRTSYLIDASGRVQGQVTSYADPFVHASMAMRTIKALDDPLNEPADYAKIDEKAAKAQAMYETELAKKAGTEARVAREKAERDAAAAEGVDLRFRDSAEGEAGKNFFEGFFGAFKKERK